MDYVIDNVMVSVDKNSDTGRAALIAYDMYLAAINDERKEDDEDA